MVDYANDTGIKQSYMVPYSVDIVFNFAPSSVTLDFRTFLQFGSIMHRHGNIYVIITVCYVVILNKLFYWGAMEDYIPSNNGYKQEKCAKHDKY